MNHLPANLAGKSLLGIGCLELCLEASRRGARAVACLLPDGELARAAGLISEHAADVELLPMSLGDDPGGHWDHVVCTHVAGHRRSPFSLIDSLARITGESLILVEKCNPRLSVSDAFIRQFHKATARLPVIFVGNEGSTGKSSTAKFTFTRKSIEHLLMRHRTLFAKVDFHQSGNEIIAVAHRRRIEHLILVSGAVSSGKTTFINALLAGNLPDVARVLGILPDNPPFVLGTSAKAERGATHMPLAICQYGFLRPYLRTAATFDRDEALDIIQCATRITVITLYPQADLLISRITRSEIEKPQGKKPSERHLKLRAEYHDAQRLATLYQNWFEFVSTIQRAKHFIAEETERGPRLIPFDAVAHSAEQRKLVYVPDSTESKLRQEFAASVLPRDLSGMSVLDVECGIGTVSREALARGATRVLAIDASADKIALARNTIPGAEFVVGCIDDLEPCGKFDIVLCYGRVSHERDPLGFIDQMIGLASSRVAFGFSSYDYTSRMSIPLPGFVAWLASLMPVMLALPNGAASSRGQPKFTFSKSAIRRILTIHRRYFSLTRIEAPLDLKQSLAVADKYRIPHLVVVAGPVSSGKSTFCKLLIEGKLDWVYEHLGIGADTRPKAVYLPRARSSSRPKGEVVLFHYNILNAYVSTARVHVHDENLDILAAANRVTVLTLMVDSNRLVHQITRSEIEGGLLHRPKERHLRLREEYRDPRRVRFHYEQWLRYVERITTDSFIVEQEGKAYHLTDTREWRQKVDPPVAG